MDTRHRTEQDLEMVKLSDQFRKVSLGSCPNFKFCVNGTPVIRKMNERAGFCKENGRNQKTAICIDLDMGGEGLSGLGSEIKKFGGSCFCG